MKILKTSAFWQILVVLTLLLATAHVPAQTQSTENEKPKPILFARLQEPKIPFSRFTGQKFATAYHRIADLPPSAPALATSKEKNSTTFSGITQTSLEKEAFDSINAERQKLNLPPLVLDSAMLYIARQHSENMAQGNFFSHRGTDGAHVDERARQAGVRDWQGIAENIAANQDSKNPVAAAIESWLKSSGHRSNLLSKTWTRSGIGIAFAPDGKFYITQVFRD